MLPPMFKWLMDAYCRRPGDAGVRGRLEGAWMMVRAMGMTDEVRDMILTYEEVDQDVLYRVVDLL